MDDGIHIHVDIKEQNKPNQFSLGRSLWIGNDVGVLSLSLSLSLTLDLAHSLTLLLTHTHSHVHTYRSMKIWMRFWHGTSSR
jgi:hypothetical protein